MNPDDAPKSYTDKRRAKNVENLVVWFGGRDKYGDRRDHVVKRFDAKLLHGLIKMISENATDFNDIIGFCRRYKQTASEIEEQDIEALKCLLDVKDVLNT